MSDAGQNVIPHPKCRTVRFQVVELAGRVYGIPDALARVDDPADPDQLGRHPAVVSAPTRELLVNRIADFDPAPFVSEVIGEIDDHRLVRHGGGVYGVPRHYGALDLNWEDDRTREGVVRGATREEAEARVLVLRAAAPVEYLGWLPTFKWFGNCGAHPQFRHTEAPPAGYKFVRSQTPAAALPPTKRGPSRLFRAWRFLTTPYRSARGLVLNLWQFGVVRCVAAILACLRLFVYLVRKTGRVRAALTFVHSRHFRSQVMAPRRLDLAFVTSIPQTFGQHPWVIEVEDSTTLFFPFLPNGQTADLDVAASPFYPMVKALLEHESCRGILTHMRSTAEGLPRLFRSEVITRKVSYAPLGVRLPDRWQTHDESDTINLLFTNSWHQQGVGFYLRGGLDVLAAFEVLHARYPQLRLTLRSPLPKLDARYRRIIEDCWVRVIDRFLPAAELDELQRGSHVYLLPSARIHIVSVLQAMSYGQAVVVSDGWGMDEYVDHDRNGLVVPGRAGKASWMDPDVGLVREDYRVMYAPDPAVVDGIVAAVSRLVGDGALRRRIGGAARADVATRYNLPNWNDALKAVFDKARAAG